MNPRNEIEELEKFEITNNISRILFVEPFYGGSHKQLIDLLIKNVPCNTFVSLKAKKWHWRARCSALILSSLIPTVTTQTVLFCSSVVSLAELIGIRSDLRNIKKIVYFHENQLVYPVRQIKERDIQFAYNQITTSLVADVVLFNSFFNMNTFLSNIKNIIKLFPDYKVKNLEIDIEPKCKVLYFPISFHNIVPVQKPQLLHIVWPHRWEFDKNPETFFNVLFKLKEDGIKFVVSVLGETFSDVPDLFTRAREVLKNEILNFGYLQTKEEYYKVLSSCHLAVSTAHHEFFGVSMLEAVYYGCYPLVPNRLVYPEIYPKDCLYNSEEELYILLKEFCLVPEEAIVRRLNMNIDLTKYSDVELMPCYLKLFDE